MQALTIAAASPPIGLADLSHGYADGTLDPVAVLTKCVDRIGRSNEAIGAVIGLDRATAIEAAAASAARWRSHAPRSPIDGAPILVKANIAVAGMPWHAGIQAYGDRIASVDAACVARLRGAGAVILGLTNMDEAALGARGDNPWLGRTHNPHRTGFTAGGSSGGSAAAVAAGFCAAALGSDTIGSVTIPAAYCGVVGHRASRALVSTDGFVPLAPTLDHGGWHTRSVTDSVMLLAALGGESRTTPLRIAALALDGLDIAPAIAAAFGAAIERVRLAGCRVHMVPRTESMRGLGRLLFEIAEIEGARVHAPLLGTRPGGFSPALRRMLAWGSGRGASLYPGHIATLAAAAAEWRAALAGDDVLLMPTTARPAFAHDAPTPDEQAMFTALPACLGWPATAVPIGQGDGLPLSAMAIGRDDGACHAAAALLAPDQTMRLVP